MNAKLTIWQDKQGDFWRCVADDVQNERGRYLMLKMCNDSQERTNLFNQFDFDRLFKPVPDCMVKYHVHIKQINAGAL